MIEPIMYFGIGFLLAALFGLLFISLVHNRAVRLTMRRVEAATPVSVAEIRADKDLLRAELAMSTRRLEMSVEKMKAKTTNQLAELSKKSEAINQLKKELGEKTTTISEIETREKALRDQLRVTEKELKNKSSSLREAERMLADKEAELVRLSTELSERSLSVDSQRVELAALRTQIEAMKVSVADYERAVRATEERLARERGEAKAAARELNEARNRMAGLAARTDDVERQLLAQIAETESLSCRIHKLEGRLADQARALAEREAEAARARGELETARKLESDLREQLSSTSARSSGAIERMRSEIGQLEAQLAAANQDRSTLQGEIVTMRREAESSWAAERVENALLRERVNDVAAEVVRLTAALEGPGSPIESMLAEAVPNVGLRRGADTGAYGPAGGPGASVGSLQPGKGTLAERIRALQSSASRATTN
jgi:chromosome segregation ATPase